MDTSKKYGFYYVLSAAAAAAVTMQHGTVSAQTCGVCAPASLQKTIAPEEIKFLGTYTAGYKVHLVVDSFYGFNGNPTVNPKVWFDYKPQFSSSGGVRAQICSYSELTEIPATVSGGGYVTCGSVGQKVTTSTVPTYITVPTAGVSSIDPWAKKVLFAWNYLGGYGFDPIGIPMDLAAGW